MIYTRYLPDKLPPSINGFVVKDANDDYTIILNPDKAHCQQVRAALHEREHIAHDYDGSINVTAIENMRHGK